MIDINCNALVELKIILFFCVEEFFFCVSSEISFQNTTMCSLRRSRSSPLNKFTDTRSELNEIFWTIEYFQNIGEQKGKFLKLWKTET